MEHNFHQLKLKDENDLIHFACHFARILAPGDLITLRGDLGVGKTTFVKWVLRALYHDPNLEVPSPTFAIVQTYEGEQHTCLHADLYRLSDASEADDIGIFEVDSHTICFVEWPERVGDEAFAHRTFDINLSYGQQHQGRDLTITACEKSKKRAKRLLERFGFLQQQQWHDADIEPVCGDASSRIYFRLNKNGRILMLMDAPKKADGPIIAKGKTYSALAKLAEDILPFVAVDQLLQNAGANVPLIEGYDLEHGFILLEDLGAGGVLANGLPVYERYEQSIETLAFLHNQNIPNTVVLENQVHYTVPNYDLDAMMTEVSLFLEWYWPHCHERKISARIREGFYKKWEKALQDISQQHEHLVLRDFHSPNIIWQGHKSGTSRVGLIDFQDALMGSSAYDVASLAQDARVDIDETFEMKLLSSYILAMRKMRPEFDTAAFGLAYSTLAAQRASKILGIFVRLSKRDGKHQYLKHLGRIQNYLKRALAHPKLSELRAWYAEHADFEV